MRRETFLSWCLAGIGGVTQQLLDAYRTGSGVPYASYGADFRDGQAGFNRPAFSNLLAADWIVNGLPVPATTASVASTEASQRLLEAAARQPFAIVLDDLHWADPDSLAMLEFLAPALIDAPLVVVATTRPDELEHLPRADLTIELTGLGAGDLAALIANLVGTTPTDELVGEVIRYTGGSPFFVGEIANHLVAAGDADSARAWATRAGDRAFAAAMYGEAAEWYGRASTPEAGPGIVVKLADALARSGRIANAAYADAARMARSTGDAEALARASLGIGTLGGGFEVRLLDDAQIALLREALDTADSPLRATLLARLSVASSLGATHDDRVTPAERGLAMARRCRDDGAIAYALSAWCDAHAGPRHSRRRLEAAAEMLAAATRADDPELELLARRFQIVALMELGDVVQAWRSIDAFAQLADRLRQPQFCWYARLVEGMRALLRGDLDTAFALATTASELGRPFGNIAQLARPLSAGDAPELVAALREFYAGGGGGPYLMFAAHPTPDVAEFGLVLGGHPPMMIRPAGVVPSDGTGLQIEVVRDAEQLAEFERTLIEAYPTPELAPFGSQSRLFAGPLLGTGWTLYVGYEAGRVVATSAAFVTDHVLAVEMVSTRPECRGRGYGLAITAAAASTRADRPSALVSSDLGNPVYRRLGYMPILRYTLWMGAR